MRFDIDRSSSGAIPRVTADIPLRERLINEEIFAVRKMVASEVRRLGLPMMYPASGTDVYFPIALTQALKVIMVDTVLGDERERRFLEDDIHELKAANVQYSRGGGILTFSCGCHLRSEN